MKACTLFLTAILAVGSLCAAEPEPSITPLRFKESPEKLLFCAKKEIVIAEIGKFAAETMPELVKKAVDLKLGQNGPLILSIIGFKGDPEQPFKVEAGFPAYRQDDDYRGDFYFRTAPKFKCVSVIYQGPISGTAAAWKKLVSDALTDGRAPSGESREIYLDWQGPDSPNTIVELQLGLQ